MSRKQPVSDLEISDLLKNVLDELERMTSAMGDVIVAVDDMQSRIISRHENLAPRPWDDEYPENRRGD